MWFIFLSCWTDPQLRYTPTYRKCMAHSVCPFKWIANWCEHSAIRGEQMFMTHGEAVDCRAATRSTICSRSSVLSLSLNAHIHWLTMWMDKHCRQYTFCISECILAADQFSAVQKRNPLCTSQSMYVIIVVSIFIGVWFVKFVSLHGKIFTVLPESQKLTVPPVSIRAITWYKFYRVRNLLLKTALNLQKSWPERIFLPDYVVEER